MNTPAPSVAGDLKKDHPGFLTALLIGAIRTYQVTLGAWLFTGVCRFTPSCSRYAEAALRSHGPARGILLATKRLLRCHPFGGSGYDPPPVPLERTMTPER